MAQDASEWTRFLTRANQLLRTTTHPAAVQLPVDGSMPSLDGATGWLNSPPLTAAGLRGQRRADRFLDLHLHQLAAHASLRPRLGRKYAGPRAGRDRRAHPGVRRRARSRQRPPGRQGHAGRLPGRGRQRLRHLECVREPLLAGVLLRRRPGADSAPSLRRRRVRTVRDDPAAAADRGRQRRRGRPGFGRARWGGGRRRLGQPVVPGELPRLRAHRELRVLQRCRLGHPSRLCRPDTVAAQPWALAGDWTVKRQAIVLNQAEGQIACRFHARDLNLVMGPAAPGSPVRFRVLLDGQPPGGPTGPTSTATATAPSAQQRVYQLIRQPGPITERTFEITFLDPGAQAYCFTFG